MGILSKIKGKIKTERSERARERKQGRAEALQRRREVFKATLESRKIQALKFARQREKIKTQRRLEALRKPRGFKPFFSGKSITSKTRRKKRRKKKKGRKK